MPERESDCLLNARQIHEVRQVMLEALAAIPDARHRVEACTQYLLSGEEFMARVREMRANALLTLRSQGVRMPELCQLTRMSRSMVRKDLARVTGTLPGGPDDDES